jgi:hypothetical protein
MPIFTPPAVQFMGSLSIMPTNSNQSIDIRSEQRGPHWIAWVGDENGKPRGSIVLVGQTREEAESRARNWVEQQRER